MIFFGRKRSSIVGGSRIPWQAIPGEEHVQMM
jgi:hypothetical protein